jgi:hypothetical protein
VPYLPIPFTGPVSMLPRGLLEPLLSTPVPGETGGADERPVPALPLSPEVAPEPTVGQSALVTEAFGPKIE